jgi:putative hemolysin
MRLMTVGNDAKPNFSKLSLSLATTTEEIREVQRLRYQVFVEAMGIESLRNSEGLEQDAYDDYCDHLIVRDTHSLKVVGTYRVMGARSVAKTGGFYSENEFDLSRLQHLKPRILEAGRACIHPDYRSGGVIMLLWAGLAACMQRERAEYLIGCASVSLADGGQTIHAVYRKLAQEHSAPADYRVEPRLPFPLHDDPVDANVTIPPLIKGYLRSGAWICGEPAWDPEFHSADLFMMLPLARLDSRYARHYLKEGVPA